MPLNDSQRDQLEEVIMDLHFTSSKYLEHEKDLHKKLLEVSIFDAIRVMDEIREDIGEDQKLEDYKILMLIPFQMYELLKKREKEAEHDEQR